MRLPGTSVAMHQEHFGFASTVDLLDGESQGSANNVVEKANNVAAPAENQDEIRFGFDAGGFDISTL